MIENYAGAFPTWLSPVQVMILPVTDRANDYSKELEKKLFDMDIRVESDLRNEKIGYKIREAQMQRVPYMLIIGDKEVENKNVSVRGRKAGDMGTLSFDSFVEMIEDEIKSKKN